MKIKRRNPGCGLLLLTVAAVLVFGVGTVCRNIGLQRLETTLREETGSREELQPFTLSAYTLLQAENVVTHFALENGELTGSLVTETAQLPENAQLPDTFYSDTSLAVLPENREEINRSATFSDNTATSKTRDFMVMREIELPDDTFLRLYMADYHSNDDRMVCAYPSTWSNMDWSLAESIPNEYSAWRSETIVRWQNSWFLGFGGTELNYQPGVWQVTESLSMEELQALPSDGEVLYGDSTVPVFCRSSEYGSVRLFYQPSDAESVLTITRLNEYLGVLYRTFDQTVCFDLVDKSGRCVQQAVICENAENDLDVSVTNTQKPDQACFVLYRTEPYTTVQIILLCVDEDGSLELVSLPDEIREEGNLAGTYVIQLSPDKQKLLSVGLEAVDVQVERHPWESEPVTYFSGYRLNVYDLNRQTVTYTGILDTGRETAWGRYLGNYDFIYGLAGELMSMDRDCYTVFPQPTQEE